MISIPSTPEELGLAFPSWRGQQKEAVQKILESEDKLIFLEGATGVGKSGILVAAYKAGGLRGPVLTRTIQLQEQYSTSFPFSRVVKGRGNFKCLVVPVTCDLGPCRFGYTCDQRSLCPYFAQREWAMNGQLVIANYPYFFLTWNGQQVPISDIVSCDEAHLLDGEITKYMTISIQKGRIDRWGMRPPDNDRDISSWASWAKDVLPQLSPKLEELRIEAQNGESGAGALITLAELENFVSSIARLSRINSDTWAQFVTRYGDDFKPIFPGREGANFLISHGRKTVFCSATILDPKVYLSSLGLEGEPYTYIQLPSPFPPRIRPVYYTNVVKVGKDFGGANQKIFMSALDDLILKYLPSGNGIIHTHTYAIARMIMQSSMFSKRMITYDPGGRDMGLAEFKEQGRRAKAEPNQAKIFVAPSMDTGVDFPYDEARWQIIAKVPFPDLSDPQVALRKAKDPQWYNHQTAAGIVQTAGRAVRALDDFAVTHIIDANFNWFYRANANLFPAWFKAAVRWVK